MSKISQIKAREILSSGGLPTLEVKVVLENGVEARASVPFGISAGVHEAKVLVDGGARYGGAGMLQAVRNVNEILAPLLQGREVSDQNKLDNLMIKTDGTANKSRLGANAILGVSMAAARAAAAERKTPLYQYLRDLSGLPLKEYILSRPMMVVIEGGAHASDSTDFQEYLFSVTGGKNISEAVRIGIECYLTLKKILKKKGYNTNVGNEGAFAPGGLKTNTEPLKYMLAAIKAAGYQAGRDVALSFDPAVSGLYKNGRYVLSKEKKKLTSGELISYFANWVKKYPVWSLEDGLAEDDWTNWPELMKQLGGKIKIVGDDLTVTNPARLQKAIDLRAINAILIKLNQIGSVSETLATIKLAHDHDIATIISHRGGGETNDTFMIDLAVAVNAAFVKVGPTRGERVEKYNRLMEIENELVAF